MAASNGSAAPATPTVDQVGKLTWVFPDGELPPPGEGPMYAHESVILLNPNSAPATIRAVIYFADADPWEFTTTVGAQRVRCLRTNVVDDMGGHVIPLETQYALALHSDVPVVAQYGRLDNRQAKLAFYTTPGYAE